MITFSAGESRSVCLPASSIRTSSNVNFAERFVHCLVIFCCLFVISHQGSTCNNSHYFLRNSFLDIVGLSSIDLLKSSGDPVGHFYVIVIIKQTTTHSCVFIQKRTLPIARDEEIFTRCCLIFIQKQNILQTLETCYI